MARATAAVCFVRYTQHRGCRLVDLVEMKKAIARIATIAKGDDRQRSICL
jgi:hypothetical protein